MKSKIFQAKEWRWAPSKQNPADIATRSKNKICTKLQEEWLSGPTYLCLETIVWPTQSVTLQTKDDKEVKKQFVGIHFQKRTCFIDVNKFSSWEVNTNFGIWHGCKICKYLKRAYKIKAERLNK